MTLRGSPTVRGSPSPCLYSRDEFFSAGLDRLVQGLIAFDVPHPQVGVVSSQHPHRLDLTFGGAAVGRPGNMWVTGGGGGGDKASVARCGVCDSGS